MAIVLKLKKGESVERGLKRLKKVLDKEGKSQRARIRNRSRRGRMELN